MNNNNKNMTFQRFAALLPVASKDNPSEVRGYPVSTLATSYKEASELAADAGLVLLGQLDANNQIIKP